MQFLHSSYLSNPQCLLREYLQFIHKDVIPSPLANLNYLLMEYYKSCTEGSLILELDFTISTTLIHIDFWTIFLEFYNHLQQSWINIFKPCMKFILQLFNKIKMKSVQPIWSPNVTILLPDPYIKMWFCAKRIYFLHLKFCSCEGWNVPLQ